jgi:hypothetical protein
MFRVDIGNMKEHFTIILNALVKPTVDKNLDDCKFNISGIRSKHQPYGKTVDVFLDVDCKTRLSVNMGLFIKRELKKSSVYIGLDPDLVTIHINQRPIYPLDLDEEKRPYQEKKIGNLKKRIFKESVDSDELVWHRDELDRSVYIEKNNGWLLQMDNELPKLMQEGRTYFIPKETYHRVIKGTGDLIIKIEEII